jgi:hypothetical protein
MSPWLETGSSPRRIATPRRGWRWGVAAAQDVLVTAADGHSLGVHMFQ